jgi:hypothetical protein
MSKNRNKDQHTTVPDVPVNEAPILVERECDQRDSVVDRRLGLDRRDVPRMAEERRGRKPGVASPVAASTPTAPAHDPLSTNLERRRGPGRRRTDFMKSAEEGEMSQEQFLFVLAIDAFKRVNNKTFPTWTDVLEVIRKLGYRKTMPTELVLGPKAEDWVEDADAPAGVFKEAAEEC